MFVVMLMQIFDFGLCNICCAPSCFNNLFDMHTDRNISEIFDLSVLYAH